MSIDRGTRKILIVNLVAALVIFLAFEGIVRIALPRNSPFPERFGSNVKYEPSGFVGYYPVPSQVIYEVEKGEILFD